MHIFFPAGKQKNKLKTGLAPHASTWRNSPLTQTLFWPFQHESFNWTEPHGQAVAAHPLKDSSRGALAAHSGIYRSTRSWSCPMSSIHIGLELPQEIWVPYFPRSLIYIYLYIMYLHQNNVKESSILFDSHFSAPLLQLLGAILHRWIDFIFHFYSAFYHSLPWKPFPLFMCVCSFCLATALNYYISAL